MDEVACFFRTAFDRASALVIEFGPSMFLHAVFSVFLVLFRSRLNKQGCLREMVLFFPSRRSGMAERKGL